MSKWRGPLISFLIGAAAAVGTSLWQCSFQDATTAGRLMSWSNGCFTAAVLWLGMGLLCFVAAFGGFDALGFMVLTLKRKFSKSQEIPAGYTYYDYKQDRSKPQQRWPVRYLMLPGAVYLVAAIVLSILFETV